jgi:general secretion pathway protein I
MRRGRSGFTLLEVMVATLIAGVAIAALIGAMTQSSRNAMRVVDHDRGALLARRKMDELLAITVWPRGVVLQGQFDAQQTGVESGWSARAVFPERPPSASPGVPALQRVELEVWWKQGEDRRTIRLNAYRRVVLENDDMPLLPQPVQPGGVLNR